MANNIISRLMVSLGLDNSKFKSGLNKSEKETKSFGKTVNKIGGMIAAAFGVSQVVRFGTELIKLAGEAEGVQRAFERMGGQAVFDELKTATRGTVSNLELMRKAVMAQNLGLPIENLGKLFEFATARAADTGESVDFLVQSIVTGIGRKSPLILDNLGISAIALKEKMDGVAIGTASVGDVAKAVGKIAEEELNKIGNAATTNGQKIQSFEAQFENLRLSLGRIITQTNEFGASLSILDGLNAFLNRSAKGSDEARDSAKRLFDIWKESGKLTPQFIKQQTDLLKQQRTDLIKNRQVTEEGGRERLQQIQTLLVLLNKQSKTQKETTQEEVRNIQFLETQIASLKEEQGLVTGDQLANVNKRIAAYEEEIKALKKLGTEIEKLPEVDPIDVAKIQGGLDTDLLTQTIKQDPPEIPVKLTTEGTFATSAELEQISQAAQASANYAAAQDQIAASTQRNAMVQQQYSSILSSVGQIAAASGDSQIASILSVAAATIQAVSQIIPVLFASSTAKAAEAGAAVPFPGNIAAIAAGVAAVASVFSGLGGGGVSSTGASVTSIDTRGFTSPTTDATRRTTTTQQSIRVEVEGRIDNKTIALSNKKGTKELQR